MISAHDLNQRQMTDGAIVDITSHYNGKQRTVYGFRLVETELPKGCVMAYFPETNPLIPMDSFAEESRTPTSKSVVVTIRTGKGDEE